MVCERQPNRCRQRRPPHTVPSTPDCRGTRAFAPRQTRASRTAIYGMPSRQKQQLVRFSCWGMPRHLRPALKQRQTHLRVEPHDVAEAQEGVLLLDAVLQVPQRGAPGADEVLQVQADGLGTRPRHLRTGCTSQDCSLHLDAHSASLANTQRDFARLALSASLRVFCCASNSADLQQPDRGAPRKNHFTSRVLQGSWQVQTASPAKHWRARWQTAKKFFRRDVKLARRWVLDAPQPRLCHARSCVMAPFLTEETKIAARKAAHSRLILGLTSSAALTSECDPAACPTTGSKRPLMCPQQEVRLNGERAPGRA